MAESSDTDRIKVKNTIDTGRSLDAPTFRNLQSSRNEYNSNEYGLSDLVQNYRFIAGLEYDDEEDIDERY